VSDRSYFRRALEVPGIVISEYYVGRISGKPAIIVAQALRDSNSVPWAVLYASLDLSSMVRSQQNHQFFDGSVITVLDRHGVVLNSWPQRDDMPIGQPLKDTEVLKMLAQEPRGTGILERSDGSKWLVSHARNGNIHNTETMTVVVPLSTYSAIEVIYRTLWISAAQALLLF